MKKNKKWLLFLAILVVAAVLFAAYKWWNKDVVAVKTAAVMSGMIEAQVAASGIVDAPVYELSPKFSAKVVGIYVKEGDRVATGDTLVEFDDTTRLVAPADGIISRKYLEDGENAIPQSPVIAVANDKKMWIESQIDEIDIADVHAGDRVKITCDVYPDKIYTGEIYWIGPVAELRKVGGRVKIDEESYVFPCKIKLLEKAPELKINMSVNVDIVTKKNDRAVIVPREAVQSVDDKTVVFKIVKDRAKQTEIKTGIRSYSSIEAVSGIGEGEIVAVSNLSKIKDKTRVKIER